MANHQLAHDLYHELTANIEDQQLQAKFVLSMSRGLHDSRRHAADYVVKDFEQCPVRWCKLARKLAEHLRSTDVHRDAASIIAGRYYASAVESHLKRGEE